MDRSEARRRLEISTEFEFVGDQVVVRDIRLLAAMAALKRAERERPSPQAGGLQLAGGTRLAA